MADLGRAAWEWCVGWWQIILFSAKLLVLALSPSSYRGANLTALARHLVKDTAPVLLWFTLMTSIISLVIIHIVVVTSVSYGLSRYALEMVVRVLVLELIPLTAAMFVALRCALPNAAEVAALRAQGALDAPASAGSDELQREVLPRVVSGTFSVLLLATVSCVVAALIAYLWVHGFTLGGLGGLHADVRPRVQPRSLADLHAEDAGPRPRRRLDSDRVGSLRSAQPTAAHQLRIAGAGATLRRHPADRGRRTRGQLHLRPGP